jgi:hypothetical protein
VRLTRRLAWLRPLAAVLGAAAFVGGGVALFSIDNSAGSLFLVTLGMVLILLAFLGERIQLESFEILGAKIRVREVVASRLQLAELVGRDEDDGRGAAMRQQAFTLRKLVDLYGLYEYIRSTEPPSDERTAALDHVAARMQEAGREAEFDPVEVSTWFHEGTDALRVVALNLMLARAEYRDFLVVLEAVDEPRSLFEQFYGLELGRAMLPSLGWLERRLLADTIKRARRKRRFRRDRWLMRLSDTILSELEN